jgi:AraC-like DNA-binding protein
VVATSDEAVERRRKRQREQVAAKRAAMTPEQRADARREYDKTYRKKHRVERRVDQNIRRRKPDPSRKRRRLDADDIGWIIEARYEYPFPLSIERIAKGLNVSVSTVQRYLREYRAAKKITERRRAA